MELINNRQQKDQQADLTLLLKLEELFSQGAKRDFCKEIGIEWDEYLHLKRKYRFVMERYRKEKKDD